MKANGFKDSRDPAPRARLEAPASGAHLGLAEGVDWQRLWFATQQRPWRSLAVIPVGRGVRTLLIARILAEVGSRHLGPCVQAADATTVTLDVLQASMDAWMKRPGSTERVLLALGPVLESPPSLALAQAADAAILCIALGESSISEASRTVDEVGRERLVGSVVFRKGQGGQ